MPIYEFTDEQVQQLTIVLANASGPGISWALTNGLLTSLQQQAQPRGDGVLDPRNPTGRKRAPQQAADGLDLGEPHG